MVKLALLGTVFVASAAICSFAYGQEYRLNPNDFRGSRAPESFDLPNGAVLANPEGMDRYRSMAEDIARTSTKQAMQDIEAAGIELGVIPEGQTPSEAYAQAAGKTVLPDGYRVTIFLSRAMGDGAILDLMDRYRDRKDVRFAFRGVNPGETIPQFGMWMRELLSPNGEEVSDLNIMLDPELFKLAGAELAPTMVLENLNSTDTSIASGKDMGGIEARAVGYTDADWLFEQAQKGNAEHSSSNAVEISEEDLIERAQREAEAVASRMTKDPDVLKNRFWDRQAHELRMMGLPAAAVDRKRYLNFMFRSEQAITDHEGKVIAHAGEVFRPHDVMPFDRRIFVFDPTNQKEVDFVSSELAKAREGVTKTMLIVTQVPPAPLGGEPWDGMQALIDQFGQQVMVLNDNFRTSFKIEATPTEIYPEAVKGRVEVASEERALQ